MKSFNSNAFGNINLNKEAVFSPQENTADIVQKLLVDNEQKASTIKKLQTRIDSLEAYLRLEHHRRYGRSSEKFEIDDSQNDLFNEVEVTVESAQEIKLPEAAQSPKKKTATKGRKPLSPNLPRHPVYLDLSDEEKQGATTTFYTKAKEELDIVPARVRVLEYFQEKAVFSDDPEPQQAVSSTSPVIICAPLRPHPIPGAVASITLLAHIIVSKYCDALPLYRLEGMMHRYGGSVTRTTMANWLMRLSVQLQPLINLMREEQRTGDIINADETPVQVIKEKAKAVSSDKYMWVTLGGRSGKSSVLFDYDPARGSEVAIRLLEDFSGYLQTDGYAGYHAVGRREGVTPLGCWDHARRKFVEAEKAAPLRKKNTPVKVSKATMALSHIRKLYQIEADIRELSAHKKYKERQQRSVPLLDSFRQWLEKHSSQMDKGGLTYKAIAYTLNQWDKLIVYCTDGRLAISNVAAENAIRPFVVGRKNWLFADTPKGARASATYYSLIETVKLHGLEPFRYFVEILQRLPKAETVEQLEQLLPWAIKPG